MSTSKSRLDSNILRGVDLVVARTIWLVLVLSALGLYIVALPFRYQQLITITPQGDTPLIILAPNEAAWLASHGVSTTAYAIYFLALETIFASVYSPTSNFQFW